MHVLKPPPGPYGMSMCIAVKSGSKKGVGQNVTVWETLAQVMSEAIKLLRWLRKKKGSKQRTERGMWTFQGRQGRGQAD